MIRTLFDVPNNSQRITTEMDPAEAQMETFWNKEEPLTEVVPMNCKTDPDDPNEKLPHDVLSIFAYTPNAGWREDIIAPLPEVTEDGHIVCLFCTKTFRTHVDYKVHERVSQEIHHPVIGFNVNLRLASYRLGCI